MSTKLTNTQLIASLMEEMNQKVKANHPVSPAEWIDISLKVESLAGDLDNFIAEQEAKVMEQEIRLIESGSVDETMTAAKAKVLKYKGIDYELYLKMCAMRKRVDSFNQLSKKRAGIKEY